ncbi:MAG: DUF86 domain-containing protein [Planctomycetes bacterium]|nr:DUF86 domain-containing protein [Planctomycetota bacterium]
MIDRDALSGRLGVLETYLREVRSFLRHSREEYAATPSLHHLAERYLHLACECVLDTAHHVIAEMGYRQPQSYREAMEVLREQGHPRGLRPEHGEAPGRGVTPGGTHAPGLAPQRARFNRRRISSLEIPPSALCLLRDRSMIARNLGCMLTWTVSQSTPLTETRAATGLPRAVTITGSRLTRRA